MKNKPSHENWNVSSAWKDIWQELEFEELSHDWLAWETRSELMLGGLILILPKNGINSFCVRAGENASTLHGVSSFYRIKFCGVENLLEISRIISEFTELSPVGIYKIAKRQGTSDLIYIGAPFEMLTAVKLKGGLIELYRTDDQGGYF